MPDLQNYSLTPAGSANVNVPRALIQARVVDSVTGQVLFDFTGANQIVFPAVWAQLTPAQRLALGDILAPHLIYMVAGLE